MNNQKITRFRGLATVVGLIAMSSTARATTKYDPLDGKAILASAEDKALAAGTSVLADIGKNLLGAAANAYMPGLGSLLGLSTENTSTQQILDAISADGGKTRDLIADFWAWAMAQNDVEIQNSFDQAMQEISAWVVQPADVRMTNRDQLAVILSDCKEALFAVGSGATPYARIDHLHAYVTLLNLVIGLEAELAEFNHIGGEWELDGAPDYELWWSSLTESDRVSITAGALNDRQAVVADLLRTGVGYSFLSYIQELNDGTLVSGVPNQSDFVTARDLQFSQLMSPCADNAGVCSLGVMIYYVGRDPDGNCANKAKYCTAYSIREGSTGTSGTRYYVEFENGGIVYYADHNAAYQHHKALVLEDMIIRGYGPVRVMAERWWKTWNLGWWDRVGLDTVLDNYVYSKDDDAVFYHVEGPLTRNGMYGQQISYLRALALEWGIDAVTAVRNAAFANIDFLETKRPYGTGYITAYPAQCHFSALGRMPTTTDDLNVHYRAQPVAKLTAIQSIL